MSGLLVAGTENISRVRKQPGDPDRTRVLIHLPVSKLDPALVLVSSAIRKNQIDG
jgi:hypothetical protein